MTDSCWEISSITTRTISREEESAGLVHQKIRFLVLLALEGGVSRIPSISSVPITTNLIQNGSIAAASQLFQLVG